MKDASGPSTPDLAELTGRGQDAFIKGMGKAPRPHQVDAVARLLLALRADCHAPSAINYLLQHATGSGKSATIALLAHQLVGWADEQGRVFSLVLVVTDRLQLDRQLSDTVTSFLAGNGYVEGEVRRAGTAAELSSFLSAAPGSEGRPKVVLTTLQKLATVWRAKSGGGRSAAGRLGAGGANGGGAAASLHRIAVIADEAHRSHGHSTTELTHQLLAAAAAGNAMGEEAAAGEANNTSLQAASAPDQGRKYKGRRGSKHDAAVQQNQRQPRSVTYFGFTATPSHRALQLFGVTTRVMCNTLGEVVAADSAAPAAPVADGTSAVQVLVVEGSATPAPSAAAGRDQLAAARQVAGGQDCEDNTDVDGEGPTDVPRLEQAIQYAPFHSYTMQQAVADGHVVDVLLNYTAVTPHLTLLTPPLKEAQNGMETAARGKAAHGVDQGKKEGGAGEEDEGAEADARLMEAAHDSRAVVRRKAMYIVDQFLNAWELAIDAGFHELRAMVVARSRRHVVWFTHEVRTALAGNARWRQLCVRASQAGQAAGMPLAAACTGSRGDSHVADVRAAVYGAFSGTVPVSEQELDEQEELMACQDPDEQPAGCPEKGVRANSSRRREEGSDVDGEEGREGSGMVEEGVEEQEPCGSSRVGRGRVGGHKRARPAVKQLRASGAWDVALAHLDVSQIPDPAPADVHGTANATTPRNGTGTARRKAQARGVKRSRSRGVSGRLGGAADAAAAGQEGLQEQDAEASSGATGGSGWTELLGGRQVSGSVRRSASVASRLGVGRREDVQVGSRSRVSVSSSDGSAQNGGGGGASGSSSDSDEGAENQDVSSSSGSDDPDSAAAQSEVCSSEEGEEPYTGSEEDEGGSSSSESLGDNEEVSEGEEVGPDGDVKVEEGEDTEEDVPLVRLKRVRWTQAASAAAGTDRVGQAAEGHGQGHSQGQGGRALARSGGGGGGGGVRAVQISEAELNGGARVDHRLARILVCCNKFETGYDDPRLGALFIDRPLAAAARAVQVLGRLNRPAPWLAKTAALVRVYDFANTASELRGAFEQFWGPTTLCTGHGSRRLRLEMTMDRSVDRLLEALAPLAAALNASSRAARRSTQEGGEGAGQGGNQDVEAGGGLHALSAQAAAGLLVRMAPALRASAEADLAAYVSAAQALGREKVELPLAFALCLQQHLASALKRMQAVSAAAAGQRGSFAAGSDGDGDDGMRQAGGGGVGSLLLDQEGVLAGGVQVACELQESFVGAIYIPPGRARPLPSRPLPTRLGLRGKGVQGAGSAGGTRVGHKGWGAYRKAKAGRSLSEVIAAALQSDSVTPGSSLGIGKVSSTTALSALAGKAAGTNMMTPGWGVASASAAAAATRGAASRRELAACLTDMCTRLREAAGTGSTAGDTAGGGAGGGGGGGRDRGAGSAAGSTGSSTAHEPDAYTALSLLRRMLLWPVDVGLLADTQAGKEVSKLKKHPNPLVASLAGQVVGQWRAQVAAQQRALQEVAAAAAAKKGKAAAGRQAAEKAGAAEARSEGGSQGAGREEEVRGKARGMLVDALRDHIKAAAATAGEAGSGAPPAIVTDEEHLALLASDMEAEVYRRYWAAAVPGTGNGPTGRQAYAARLRTLVPALRLADGVSAQLLSGGVGACEVAGMEPARLAPAAIKQQLEAAAKRRAADEAWERAVGVSVGGGTFVANTKCPNCGSAKATVQTVLSGGTYAQERVQVQKFTCQDCNHTWRADE